MIKKITILSTFFILFLTFGELKGQDTSLGAGISSDSAFAIQANICRLNDGQWNVMKLLMQDILNGLKKMK